MASKEFPYNALSLHTYHLNMVFYETDQSLGKGTGFVYLYEGIYYMITNGHNVTGVNPTTNKRMSDHCGFPTLIRLKVKGIAGEPPEQGYYSGDVIIDIYKDTKENPEGSSPDTNFPLWYIHPKYGYKVDVIAIPLFPIDGIPKHVQLFPINQFNFDEIQPRVSDDVYILGYPFAIKSGLEFPIWKKGSIASEPNYPVNDLPKILIDTATRSGMSGSPVIIKREGIHFLKESKLPQDATIGTVQSFLGIYSGRLGAEDEFSAQLGIVWKKELIDEILAAKQIGSIDFQNILTEN